MTISTLSTPAYAAIRATQQAAESAASSCQAAQDAIANLQLPPPAPLLSWPSLPFSASSFIGAPVVSMVAGAIVYVVVSAFYRHFFPPAPRLPATVAELRAAFPHILADAEKAVSVVRTDAAKL